MIGRYTSKNMTGVWSDQSKYTAWAYVELEVMKAQGRNGIVPPDLWRVLNLVLIPTPNQVSEQEKTLKHDVMAFLEAWRKNTDNQEIHRWLHYGLTSSDVVETGQALLLEQTNWLITHAGQTLLDALIKHAFEHKDTKRIGRTHGQFAEPTTWGYRVADIAFAVSRGLDRLAQSANAVQTVHISGPLGNYAHTPRSVELDVAKALGLAVPDSATQVLMRDSLGAWAYSLASLATICEAFALEVRHGQRSEIQEIYEGRSPGQEGSSSMPHKENPITAEKICGLARMARAYVMPITEGVALWHERDISHSSVERIAVPDLSAITEHLLTQTTDMINNLQINKPRMAGHTHEGSTTTLNKYIQQGTTRNEAYLKAKTSDREPCAPADTQHTWDLLSTLKTRRDETRYLNGVSF